MPLQAVDLPWRAVNLSTTAGSGPATAGSRFQNPLRVVEGLTGYGNIISKSPLFTQNHGIFCLVYKIFDETCDFFTREFTKMLVTICIMYWFMDTIHHIRSMTWYRALAQLKIW